MKTLGKSFYLRPLLKKDLSEEYFSWLKDREVNQFLDVRFSVPDRKKAETNLGWCLILTSFLIFKSRLPILTQD